MIHGETLYDAMANGNGNLFEECPKAKKSKTNVEDSEPLVLEPQSQWERLPEDIMREIFSYLSYRDVIQASSVCMSWRNSLYFARYWRNITFPITMATLSKAQYYRQAGSQSVIHATIKFNSLDSACVHEVLRLMSSLTTNTNLKSLMLEPSHCHMEDTNDVYQNKSNTSPDKILLTQIVRLLTTTSLQRLSLGLNEELLQHIPRFLRQLGQGRPEEVTTLGLASLKDDPTNYLICHYDGAMLAPFRNLQILSIDYDTLSDKLLAQLSATPKLRRLCVHVHGIWDAHPGTTEQSWLTFRKSNPLCELRLALIHAFDEVTIMHREILRKGMPLGTIKVLFCENMNIEALHMLEHYKDTLRSVMWVDSHNKNQNSYADAFIEFERANTVHDDERHLIDPLIMLAWSCKKLEEITLIGYNYYAINWVGVSRLGCETLKSVKFVAEDVVYADSGVRDYLAVHWSPMHLSDLHPVLADATAGDSDEYLMPILQADLY